MNERRCLAAILLFYCALALGLALTRTPMSDEGVFACAAYNLAFNGHMGTTVVETAGTPFPGLNEHTYWQPPLHFIVLAAFFRMFGFSLLVMRGLSIAIGLIALFACYRFMLQLSARSEIALLSTALLAVDTSFLLGASNGRMDVMCVALGLAGLAAYVGLRKDDLPKALL